MKLIIEISEGLYKHVDTIQNGSIGAKQILNAVKDGIPAYKAIPSAEPTWAINDKGEKVAFQDMSVNKAIFLLKLMDAYHEGMTKGEIMHKLFPNDYFVVGEYGFDEKWWNSPYEPQESEDKE